MEILFSLYFVTFVLTRTSTSILAQTSYQTPQNVNFNNNRQNSNFQAPQNVNFNNNRQNSNFQLPQNVNFNNNRQNSNFQTPQNVIFNNNRQNSNFQILTPQNVNRQNQYGILLNISPVNNVRPSNPINYGANPGNFNNVDNSVNTINTINSASPPSTGMSDIQAFEDRYFDLFLTNPYDEPPVPQNPVGAGGAAGGGAGGAASDIGAAAQAPDEFAQFQAPLSTANQLCPRGSFFASYLPTHRSAVSTIVAQYNSNNLDRFYNISRYLKTNRNVHPKVWYSAVLRAQLARMPETMGMRRPNPIELFPTTFFPDRLVRQKTQTPQECVVLDGRFGRDNGIENALWYFREDVQMNAHHWIWHLLYPGESANPIDRRGEFFYFFHHELIARYITERIVNNLLPQEPLNIDLNTIIEEGYNPHLAEGISTRAWAPRQPFQHLESVLNDTIYGNLASLVRSKNRVLQALGEGTVVTINGSPLPIHRFDRINLLGELSEASMHAINPAFYGMDGYHILGHLIISNLVGNVSQNVQGVMGDVATAMRDPIFYRWHRFVDSIFLKYKSTYLEPYQLDDGENPLILRGISINSVRVIADNPQKSVNSLKTFWNSRRFDLTGGLDFNSANDTSRVNVNICAKHLDHEEFDYELNIENNRNFDTLAFVRIFMAPRFKSARSRNRFTMEEQRTLFFTMDSFTTLLRRGNNLMTRRSTESTVTAPWPKSVDQLQREISSGVRIRSDCDCGYPHHLLLPKGTDDGMVFDIFVMVTDGKKDIIIDRLAQNRNPDMPKCTPSHVHCGIQGGTYPDAKPMGYPFDRRPYAEVADLEEYVRYIPNSAAIQVSIFHEDVQRGLDNYSQV